MGFFDWLKGFFSDSQHGDAYWIHARCDQCQQVLRTRVDLAHDLSTRYDSSGRIEGYFTRKTLVGSDNCFNQVEVRVEFDTRRRPQRQEIQGGQLISREEYMEAVTNASPEVTE